MYPIYGDCPGTEEYRDHFRVCRGTAARNDRPCRNYNGSNRRNPMDADRRRRSQREHKSNNTPATCRISEIKFDEL